MAANYAANHEDLIKGLLLWDAYSANDLTKSTVKVRMIHRADASGKPPEDYSSKLPLLPKQTEYIPLVGGQHLNFGRFIAGRLYRDAEPAKLDPDEQRAQAAAASVDFMQAL